MADYPVHHGASTSGDAGDGGPDVETLVSRTVLDQIVEHAVSEVDGAELIHDGALARLIAGRRPVPATDRLETRRAAGAARAHVLPARGHGLVRVDGGRLRAQLALTVRQGLVLPDVAEEVQRRVTEQLEAMVELPVEAVDVAVEALAPRDA